MLLMLSSLSSCQGGAERDQPAGQRCTCWQELAESAGQRKSEWRGRGTVFQREGEGTVKGRGYESECLGLWTAGRIEVSRWAFMPRLMGPDSAEYTEGQQGSTLNFLFTQSTAL